MFSFYNKSINKNGKKMIENSELGITLISLVVAVIIILILAGISISMIIGKNGILNRAGEAKAKTETEGEKEQIKLSAMASLSEKGEIIEEKFQENLDSNLKGNIIGLYKDDQDYIIKLDNNKVYRYSTKDGEVLKESMNIFIEDTTPGAFDGLGTEESPYTIMSIEDLVYFSQSVNNGTTYEGKTIVLGRNLNFKSDLSYANPKSIEYGDLNNDGIIDTIRNELTKNDANCSGFPIIGSSRRPFAGMFDGLEKQISNIYQNNHGGLFGCNRGEIRNLSLSGNIFAGTIGAIVVINDGVVFNCRNYANINARATGAHNGSGGICAINNMLVDRCVNYGTIVSYSNVGGIVGITQGENALVRNSCNLGEVKAIGAKRSYIN